MMMMMMMIPALILAHFSSSTSLGLKFSNPQQ